MEMEANYFLEMEGSNLILYDYHKLSSPHILHTLMRHSLRSRLDIGGRRVCIWQLRAVLVIQPPPSNSGAHACMPACVNGMERDRSRGHLLLR